MHDPTDIQRYVEMVISPGPGQSIFSELATSLPKNDLIQIHNQNPKTMYDTLPDIDDENLEKKMTEILESDRLLMQRIYMLKPFLNWNEKMAAGLHAYWAIDNSHTQLCELKPKHGEFSAALRSVIDLIQSLSPQAKAEFASDTLLEDWEMSPAVADSPTTLIE
jgi:hypothetical protein